MTHGVLRRMLEWLIEAARGWEWKPGAYGRGIELELPADVVAELAAAHGSVERTVALFRRAAREVGNALGYTYPQRADDVVSAYIDAGQLTSLAAEPTRETGPTPQKRRRVSVALSPLSRSATGGGERPQATFEVAADL
jgi:hypothetical protein